MMKASFLNVDASSVSTRTNGPALGNMHLVINGMDFPSQGWNDFVVVVLGWWVDALLRLLHKVHTQETVNFMDGPYSVEIMFVSPNVLRFRPIGGKADTDFGIGETLSGPFSEELIVQSRTVLDECVRQNWWSKDADILLSSLKTLEQIVATR